ncbi:MAG: C39 family peptidase [Roseburia sp.]|nr:C39 family peptidase [Roseburia sp.]
MKKKKGIFMILAVTLVVFTAVVAVFLQGEIAQADNELVFDANTESAMTEAVEDTEEVAEIEEVEKSYIELYGLEEVDKPEKRTEEQIILKLEELAEEYEMIREIYENVDAYSIVMLDHLANNPEMAAYVLGALESDGSVTGGFSETELEAEFPLLLQFDPRWGYFEYGGKEMGISGCGPTCLAMTILALTDYEDVTPDKIAAYSLANEYYVKDVGTAWKLIDEFPTLYGLTVTNPGINEELMKAELDKGNVLICSVRKGIFTAGGHFIVIYGYDETGFKVNDPMCVARSNKTWTYAQFGRQIKRIWSVGVKYEAFSAGEMVR